jgi:transcriptional regulator GlxA family with amidase domain
MARPAGRPPAALSARFTSTVGQSPARQLSTPRLQRAEDALMPTSVPLARIAAEASYHNEYAFATAFLEISGRRTYRITRE